MSGSLLPHNFVLSYQQDMPCDLEFTVDPPAELIQKFLTITSRSRANTVVGKFASVYPSIFDGLEPLLENFDPSYQDPVDSELIFTPRGISSEVQSGSFHTDGVPGRGRRLFVALYHIRNSLSSLQFFEFLKLSNKFQFANPADRYTAMATLEKLSPFLVRWLCFSPILFSFMISLLAFLENRDNWKTALSPRSRAVACLSSTFPFPDI